MKPVAKYNTFKGVSTVLTVGTPIASLCMCSDFFIHRSDTAISAGGIFALLLSLLFFKDKIVEKFKMPSAFVLSSIVFTLILIVESIILPLKYVALATMCTSGIDELTFKRWYKNIEVKLPNETIKTVGFIFSTSDKLLGGTNGQCSK